MSPKMGFSGILEGGAKIFGGNPLGMQCNDRRSMSFGEKKCGDVLNSLL